MRLAHRALIAALVSLVLCAAVSAQTLRSPDDPRNQSPSVGTGGPEGGPTGLFTIYDGSTLRRGEFTFSIAYSNYDRDPGNVDIVDVPLSFNDLCRYADAHHVDTRTAAYMLAIDRVAYDTRMRGIYA